MTDTVAKDEDQIELEKQIEKMRANAKKGFDLESRMKNRGIRSDSIVLFLDEDKGVEYGWAFDAVDALGNPIGRSRGGIIGEIDALEYEKRDITSKHATATVRASLDEQASPEEPDFTEIDKKIKRLEAKRVSLYKELEAGGITVSMSAIPPKLEREAHRLARLKLGIKDKGVPAARAEELEEVKTRFMMCAIITSIKENESGAVNEGMTYEDAELLLDQLPPSQQYRLDMKLGEIQYTDAISRTIESQEDF